KKKKKKTCSFIAAIKIRNFPNSIFQVSKSSRHSCFLLSRYEEYLDTSGAIVSDSPQRRTIFSLERILYLETHVATRVADYSHLGCQDADEDCLSSRPRRPRNSRSRMPPQTIYPCPWLVH
ncbi:unnamed protein product, partial [Heterotrigona itama]